MGICDWWVKWRYDRAFKRGMDALDKSIEGYKEYPRTYVALHTCPPFEGNPADCALNKKPDTVESVLNQFIALGHDKPEVVIKGVTRQDGSGRYTVKIDGVELRRTVSEGYISYSVDSYNSIKSAESAAVRRLKDVLGNIPVEEIEITY